MQWQKSFDELLAGLLVDYANQFPGVDLSPGSLVFIKSACTASAVWGIYQHQQYIYRQIFADTSDTEHLEHHCQDVGIVRLAGETDAALLERYQTKRRNPPAGGNQYDYVQWARAVEGVRLAWSYPRARGNGTVDVVVLADAVLTGDEIPTQVLLDAVLAYIDPRRPAGMASPDPVLIFAPTPLVTDVTMSTVGLNVDVAQIKADIEAYLSTFIPGQILYLTQLSAIALANGAMDASVTAPAAAVIPVNYEMIRPGVVNVT
jgi:uncharacterized phage protein gp47/JayE